jgi:hypothetical protein
MVEFQGTPFRIPNPKYPLDSEEGWQEKRIAYMMDRLTAGRHPDTDPSFWNDFKIERPTINVAR